MKDDRRRAGLLSSWEAVRITVMLALAFVGRLAADAYSVDIPLGMVGLLAFVTVYGSYAYIVLRRDAKRRGGGGA